jgi:hypothetical protein
MSRQIQAAATSSGKEDEERMSSEQIVVGLAAITAAFALWAAIFATRADGAARRAGKVADARWETATKPVPQITFTGPPAPNQPIEVEVQNLGGTLVAGGVIVQAGDDLYASELILPEKAPPRRILLQPAMKAWQRAGQPSCLLLVARDVSGRYWNCLDAGQPIKDPRRWLAGQLRELRLQGVVDFPGLNVPAR